MKFVLIVENDRKRGELIRDALVEESFFAELVTTEIEAYGRLSLLPRVDAVILEASAKSRTATYDIVRFARQVAPKILVIYIGDKLPTTSPGVQELAFQKPFARADIVEALRSTLGACAA